MTGDEAVDPNFDRSDAVHRGAVTAVEENAGPVHRQDADAFPSKSTI